MGISVGCFSCSAISIALQYAWPTLFGAVIIEELAKLIALIVIFRRGSIQSWSDGLVMGGFIGLGFAAFEDVIYAINGNDKWASGAKSPEAPRLPCSYIIGVIC